MGKRTQDLSLLILVAPVGVVLTALVALVCLIAQGRPIFFAQTRAGRNGRAFRMWKFRSMRFDGDDAGVCGGDKAGRITRLGRWMRALHLDELPQIWNILRGDMSFVGPRPPLEVYVADYPEIYGKVLQDRPGLTGLASCVFAGNEARILARCPDPTETDQVYRRRCIPRKARLDLIYQKRRTVWLDLWILLRTLTGRRFPRLQHARAVLEVPKQAAAQGARDRLTTVDPVARPVGRPRAGPAQPLGQSDQSEFLHQ